ncbi:MAG: hypothetical protein ACYTE8_09445 [Planctomycetota bacterium]|jgi:Spy/CpxP family protein refolding chaperone
MIDTDNEKILLQRVQQWKMAFFSLIILIAGIAIGCGVTLILVHNKLSPPPMDIEMINEQVVGRLQHQLNLTDEQRQQFRDILTKHITALHEIRQQARPRVASQMNQLHTDVMAILDENQQQIWQQNINSLRDRFLSGKGPGRGFGPGGGRGPRDGSGPRGPMPHRRPFDFWEQGQNGFGPHKPPPPPPPPPPGY